MPVFFIMTFSFQGVQLIYSTEAQVLIYTVLNIKTCLEQIRFQNLKKLSRVTYASCVQPQSGRDGSWYDDSIILRLVSRHALAGGTTAIDVSLCMDINAHKQSQPSQQKPT